MSTTNSDTVSESNRTGVTFSNDVETSTQPHKRASFDKGTDLTKSAKIWDIDGDGQLDEAELALKEMDKSHEGKLTQQQMYDLMTNNLQTQRELFKVKKVVIGLVVFTCILALSNLGTSFAAAFLAKDSKSSDGKLVDTKSGRTLETASQRDNFVVDQEFNARYRARQRHLCEVSSAGGGVKDAACSSTNAVAVSTAVGRDIAEHCHRGNTVSLTIEFTSGGVAHPLCGADFTELYPATSDATQWVGNGGNRQPKWVEANSRTVKPNTADSAYELTGFESGLGEFCDADGDCITGASCDTQQDQSKRCKLSLDQVCDVDGDCITGSSCITQQDQSKRCKCTGNGDNSACASGEVCGMSCVSAGGGNYCTTQANLDSECVSYYGAGTTCPAPHGACMAAPLPFDPVREDGGR